MGKFKDLIARTLPTSLTMLPSLLTVLLSFSYVVAENNYPIIGLFSQPSTSTEGDCGGDCLYIAASYVKNIESGGGRVVPINFYASEEELDKIFDSVNGIFFPGGGAPFPHAAQYIFDKVKSANDNGIFTPLWGSCMGFQWLLVAQSQDESILDPPSGQMDSYNISMNLNFTNDFMDSKLFKNAPKEVVKILATEQVTMNNHHYGIFPDHLDSTPSLASFFHVLSNNFDRQGLEFVSTMEAFNYPIYGIQWHAEKNMFEWQMNDDGTPYEAINHSRDAVLISQYMIDFFIDESRKNNNKFPTPESEANALIYNYQPIKTAGDFVQKYFFPLDFSVKF